MVALPFTVMEAFDRTLHPLMVNDGLPWAETPDPLLLRATRQGCGVVLSSAQLTALRVTDAEEIIVRVSSKGTV